MLPVYRFVGLFTTNTFNKWLKWDTTIRNSGKHCWNPMFTITHHNCCFLLLLIEWICIISQLPYLQIHVLSDDGEIEAPSQWHHAVLNCNLIIVQAGWCRVFAGDVFRGFVWSSGEINDDISQWIFTNSYRTVEFLNYAS